MTLYACPGAPGLKAPGAAGLPSKGLPVAKSTAVA